ncbi:ATP-dependent DNA helicase [Mesotoga sp.]|uniref:ATP-dependent DNA helicase n=1 Tax=Mesotoga sp. TaxID=2053577 RepID=UPI00345F141A
MVNILPVVFNIGEQRHYLRSKGLIAESIVRNYPHLNEDQRAIISHEDGPLLAIAGPGSGKTFCIVLRALNLLLMEKALPSEITLCTFTEKAAFELRDRLSAAARKVGYKSKISEITVSTIHGWCNKLLMKYRFRTKLGQNFEMLDELTQLLFIFDNFEEITGSSGEKGSFLTKWKTKWTAIVGAREYFDKITEELIDSEKLIESNDPFVSAIGNAYRKYEECLFRSNRVDFAHLQKIVYELLTDSTVLQTVTDSTKYVLVDEYQDTNYVQEQLLLKLTEKTGNLCVVGDEDQSLYRFRGATVRNILEFPQKVANCKVVKLTTNYRSHPEIINRYDRWMSSVNWSGPIGKKYRYDKTITANSNAVVADYPSVFSIWGNNPNDEAQRVVELVKYLKEKEIVEDYNQIALLLHSARQCYSGHYLEAFSRDGISAFCPRARTYFDNEEIRDMVACFAAILGWYEGNRGQLAGPTEKLARYVDDAIIDLASRLETLGQLPLTLQEWNNEIESMQRGMTLDRRPADYFYQLLSFDPFRTAIMNENKAHNLAIFSRLLNVFQNYYHYTVITYNNRETIRLHMFNSFLRFLYDGGINEYEDSNLPFPKNHVQVMTIHQSKGLEFPIVIVGSLAARISSRKQVDKTLSAYYHRPPFEPDGKITLFDRMRLHYVAFSRAEKVLVLTSAEKPKEHFAGIWEGLPQWPYVEKELLTAQHFEMKERIPVKKTYSFTSDLKIYETCPRQYEFFRYYDFTPSRSAVIFFGLLVHQTIEEIHHIAMRAEISALNEQNIRQLFERTFQFLTMSDVRPIGKESKESAFKQVMNYYNQNKAEMGRIIQTEVDVSLEKDEYILNGKVDLLLGGDGRFELLDFKTSPKPKEDPELLRNYERQLCTYAYILEQRYGKHVDRMLLYWTSEPNKEDALMSLPYDALKVEEAGTHFDSIVGRIQSKQFEIERPPESKICKECDLRILCFTQGIIKKTQ